MNNITLTDEQLAVVKHPLGQHARVLAVAGSGKSFTIAHSASRLISQNAQRMNKQVIAFQIDKPGFIQLFAHGYSANKALVEQVQALIQGDGVLPQEIAVLSRLYAQMDHLETEFLNQQIPYRVEGHQPFFKRSEIKILLDYLRLSIDYAEPLDDNRIKLFLGLANKPNRMLSRGALERLIQEASTMRLSLQETLYNAAQRGFFDLTPWQVKKLEELSDILTHLHMGIADEVMAGELLSELVQQTGYLDAFQNYYGKGEHADGKIMAVENFLEYVRHTRLTPVSLLELIEKLDTTQGAPEEEQVVFTTVFRTKGLEYDYVFLPECNESALPYLKGERVDIYDLKARFQVDPLSDKLESERRLFYVALTRARKGVFIGAGEHPSRFLAEIQSQEVTMA